MPFSRAVVKSLLGAAVIAIACAATPAWSQIAYNSAADSTWKALDGATVNGKIHVQLGQKTSGPWTLALDGKANTDSSSPFVLANEQGDASDRALYDTSVLADGKHNATAQNAAGTKLAASFTVKNATSSPPAVGSLLLTVDSANPRWDSLAPISSNLFADLSVRLYGAEQGQTKTLLDATPWTVSVKFRREGPSGAVFCFAASLALDTNGDSVPDRESPQSAEWCGAFALPPELHLLPPNGISGQSPAP